MIRQFFGEIIALAILAVLMFAAMCFATPAPAPKGPVLPDLNGKCQFGDVVQNKRQVLVISEYWNATGEINAKGFLVLHWTNTSNGEPVVGFYSLAEEGKAIGHFGRESETIVGETDICGESLTSETLFFRKTEPAPMPEGVDQ